MPQFLTTAGTSHTIEDIIIRAKSELVLITPYLKLSRILFERLTDASHRGVRIQVVYGKSELQHSERRQLNSLTGIELLFLENLHAKCYYNESTLIVSSMNLYEFSEKNNREMGIMLTRRDDAECFADALAEAQSIINAARGSTPSVSPAIIVEPTTTVTQPLPILQEKRDYDQTIMVQKVFEMLKELPDAKELLIIKTEPISEQNNKLFSTISAQEYPRKGIGFSFAGAFRFSFTKSDDYQAVKDIQRSEIHRLLGGDYRCYWNKNVLSVYAAQNYKQSNEAIRAAYLVKAFKDVTSILKRLPLTVRVTSPNR